MIFRRNSNLKTICLLQRGIIIVVLTYTIMCFICLFYEQFIIKYIMIYYYMIQYTKKYRKSIYTKFTYLLQYYVHLVF